MGETKIPDGYKNPRGVEALSKNVALGSPLKGLSQKGLPLQNARSSTQDLSVKVPEKIPEKISMETAGKINLEKTLAPREFFTQSAAALGLPKDPLSTVLLAFARFFSLSPSLLANLRRETLNQLKSSSPQNSKESAVMEGKALAASAALDKGVNLRPAALDHYSRFFVPYTEENSKKPLQEQKDPPAAEELRGIAEEQSNSDDLLAFLNNMPGRNGQKWLVYSFNINVKGTELKVLLRILAKEGSESDYFIANITGPKRQWHCLIRANQGKFHGDIRVFPELSGRTINNLSKKLKDFLGPGFEEILLRNGEEYPSWVENLYDEPLLFIDKEV